MSTMCRDNTPDRRTQSTDTPYLPQYAKKDWHQRLDSGGYADVIMDRIVHNTRALRSARRR